ncbi:condensation domain-containing protein [Serratia marcescens]|uniref:condensation domain-containing protein n=1 Tax=Serratia marcescens TaxID=615 RepID=UPI003EDA17EB
MPRGAALPLSFAQQRLWFLTQLEGLSETYHIPLALSLRGELDLPAWRQSLDALYARHEALRSQPVCHRRGAAAGAHSAGRRAAVDGSRSAWAAGCSEPGAATGAAPDGGAF